jgi:hypothetical protein
MGPLLVSLPCSPSSSWRGPGGWFLRDGLETSRRDRPAWGILRVPRHPRDPRRATVFRRHIRLMPLRYAHFSGEDLQAAVGTLDYGLTVGTKREQGTDL